MTAPTRTRFRVGEAELSVLVAGPPDGEPVLLVHGIPAGAELWRDTLGRLAAAGFRGLAPDMPGYGGTRLPEGGDHSLAGAAELFAAWLARERIGPVWLVGHDLGGGVAQILTVRHPEHVGRLTLSHSVVADSWPVPIVSLLRSVARLGLYRPLAATGEPYVDPWLRRELRRAFARPERLKESDVRKRVFFDSKVSDREGRREFARHLAALDNGQTLEVARGLGEVRVPTLLLWGREDPHQPWEKVGKRLEGLIPEADVVLLEDAGHFAMLDRPEAFAEALLAWRG